MRRRRLLIALAVLVAVALAAVALGPTVARQVITAKAQSAAQQAGADLSWGELELDLGGVTLRDVRLAHPRARARIDEVQLDVALAAALTGDVELTGARIVRPDIALTIEPPTTDIQRTGDTDAPTSPLAELVRRLDRLPPTVVDAPRISARVDGRRMEARGSRVDVRVDADGLTVDGEGQVTLDGRPAVAGHVAALLDTDGRIRATLTGGDGPLLTLDRAGVRAAVDAATVTGTRRSGAVTLEAVRAEVDGASVTEAVIGLRWRPGEATLVIEGARVRAETAITERLLGLLGRDAAPDAMPDDIADDSDGMPGPTNAHINITKSPQGALDGMLAALERRAGALAGADLNGVTLTVDGVSVTAAGLPAAREIRGTLRRDGLSGRAVIAGGEVTVDATWTPGRGRPDTVAMTADGVQLAPLFARRLPPTPPLRQRPPPRADGVIDGALYLVGRDGPIGRSATLIDGRVAWREGRIELAGLSPAPVDGIDLAFDGSFDWHPALDQLVGSGRVAQGPLAMGGEGRIDDLQGDPVVHLSARGEAIDCAEAFAAIPRGLWGPYDRARLSGRLEPTIRLFWPVHRPAVLELKIRKLFKACTIETLAAREGPDARVEGRPAPALDDVGWLDSRFVMPVREGTSREVLIGPGAPGWVPLASLPRYVGATMYQSEEMNFWRNNAIDRGLLMRALRINLGAGRFVYGGSTVTQQLVKNLFLTRHKSLARKLQELLIATRITQAIDRHRVLELYLNCIEFGPDLYGIGRASRYYFQKHASALTPREAVFLAMLKPAPRRGAWYKRRGHSPDHPWWVGRAEELMGRLVEGGQISAATAAAERPYHLIWVDGQYVDRRGSTPATPEAAPPDAPAPPDPRPPPPFGGRRLPIAPN